MTAVPVEAVPEMERGCYQTSSHRVLEPIERISEVLFGLIMVLTFTCTFSVVEAGRAEIRALLVGALGCNFAWGIIDAIMYLMGCLAERARAISTLRAVRKAPNPDHAQRHIAKALPPLLGPLMSSAMFQELHAQLLRLPDPPSHPRLSKMDWVRAGEVFLIVNLATFPVVLPFLFMATALRAQRLSNLIAVGMLFLTGYAFGRCTGYHPKTMGIGMVVLGGMLVGLTILLGG
jgi:hypothetical protein